MSSALLEQGPSVTVQQTRGPHGVCVCAVMRPFSSSFWGSRLLRASSLDFPSVRRIARVARCDAIASEVVAQLEFAVFWGALRAEWEAHVCGDNCGVL